MKTTLSPSVIPGWSAGPDRRCAIAHRGISRFRVRCFASPRNDDLAKSSLGGTPKIGNLPVMVPAMDDKTETQAKAGAMIVPVTLFEQNCTIIWHEPSKKAVVIDPGGDVPKILEAIKQTGVTVEKIWLTHGHIDHVGGAADLRDALQVKIEGPHIADKYLLDNVVSSGERFGMTDVRNFGPDRWLDEGEQVSIGDLTFDIYHCPGHSPGSVVFFNKELRFAHVGDVLFNGSVGRTDLPGGSHATLINSIKEKLLPLGDDVGFICGHGAGSSIGQERLTNPFITGEIGI